MQNAKPLIASMIELPFGLPGKIFRSPMPFGMYDRKGSLLADYKQENISAIVLLLSDVDSQEISGLNLRQFYVDLGMEVLHLPIADFDLPTDGRLQEILSAVIANAQTARNQVVHCHAGIGRTGLFLACLARQVLHYEGEQAIQWVRQYVPGALETPEQVEYVMKYERS